jgi:hypothetical protein
MTKEQGSWKAFLIVLGVLVLIAVAILFAKKVYVPRSPYPTVTYNNFEFEQIEGMWYVKWQRDGNVYNMGFRYNPKEVENVPVRGALNATFRRQPFYVTFDPDGDQSNFKYIALGIAELGLNVVRAMDGRIESACTRNVSEACEGHPIVSCDDDDKAVIYFKTMNETRVRLDGNCMTIEGTGLEMLRAVDRVLFHFMNIQQ